MTPLFTSWGPGASGLAGSRVARGSSANLEGPPPLGNALSRTLRARRGLVKEMARAASVDGTEDPARVDAQHFTHTRKEHTMTTATKPSNSQHAKNSTIATELDHLEAATAKAQAASRKAKIAAEQWDRETTEMKVAISIRLQAHPDEFATGTGIAKPGTEAAKLEEATKERMHGPNPRLAESAQATAVFHQAGALLEQFKVERIADRLALLEPDHDAAERAIRLAAAAFVKGCEMYRDNAEAAKAVISSTPPLERGTEPSLTFDGRVGEWHKFARDIQDTEIARPGLSEMAVWKLANHG